MSTAVVQFKALDDEFYNQFIQDNPIPFTPVGEFTYYRTYSAYDYDLKRRETAYETFRRAVEYNASLVEHIKPVPVEETRKLFANHAALKQFLSGRTLWVGGRQVAYDYPMSNFNCAFEVIEKWDDFCDLFYLLMIGTGVGHRELLSDTAKLPPIRPNTQLWFDNFIPVPKEERLEKSTMTELSSIHVRITVGDSKEGWVEALRMYFVVLTAEQYESVRYISIDFSNVRPKGERLKKFGGTASGHQSLQNMFVSIHTVLSDLSDGAVPYVKLRPIDVLDIANIIGKNVVVGGVRRTAEDGLGSVEDKEWQFAKFGINGFWTESQQEFARKVKEKFPDYVYDIFPADKEKYRRMSNNSVYYEEKPTREEFADHMFILRGEGEPGFLNAEAASKRRPNFKGVNPCFEILLDSKGLCNLTTVVVMAFIFYDAYGNAHLDLTELFEAQRLSARAGVRMTCVDLELPQWDFVQKRDRLIGTSLTGWQDAMAALGFTEEQEIALLEMLHNVSRSAADEYADELGIPRPLLTTTVKPEGTQSLMAGAKSSGITYSHSPFYIRRIRVNYSDPLAKAIMNMNGWVVHPEVGEDWVEHFQVVDENFQVVNDFVQRELAQAEVEVLNAKEDGHTYQMNHLKNITTLVVDFPVKTPAKKTKYDVTAIEQLECYKRFQRHYTEHNTSNTIHVREHEWELVEQWLWDNWDETIAVSFLSLDDHTYKLAPYQQISEDEYNRMISQMQMFDPELLREFDNGQDFELGNDGCENGICPVR